MVEGDNLDLASGQGPDEHAIYPDGHHPPSIPARQPLFGPFFADGEISFSLILQRADNYGIHTLFSLHWRPCRRLSCRRGLAGQQQDGRDEAA